MNKMSIASLVAGIVSLAVSIWSYMQYQSTVQIMSYLASNGGYFVFSQYDVDLYFNLFIILLILGIILIIVAIILAIRD